jgi:multidrug efflux pump subunit AcrA (membrane-fusion protein)
VFFDVDDRSDLRLRQLMADGKLDLSPGGKSRVGVGLPDRDEFTLSGPVRFIDTQINAGTGTTTLRADVDNPKGLLTPGLFVRVRLPIGDPKPGVLVPEEAIGTDQGLKFVYTLNANDEAVYRPVKPGLAYGNLRVVEPVPGKPDSGVSESDRVIVEGVQRVRKGQKVTVRSGQKPVTSGQKEPESGQAGAPATSKATATAGQ